MIVAVAIRIRGSLICTLPRPARHEDVRQQLSSCGVASNDDREDGFITNDGAFLGRAEAMVHARKCKQLKPRLQPEDPIGAARRISTRDALYSEDLW